jgi:nitric oxide reductase NorD protein
MASLSRLRELAGRLGPELRALRRSMPDALRLLRQDPATLRAWLRQVRAVEQTLGSGVAQAYTHTVLLAISADSAAALVLAHELPDHLAAVQPEDRSRLISLVQAVLADSAAASAVVARSLPQLLPVMDDTSLSDFVAQGVALHDQSPKKALSFLKLESEGSRVAASSLVTGTGLLEVHRMLTHYARAHCGERVRVRPGGGRSFSDGVHIYLPERIDVFNDERDEQIYRLRTALGAGFIEFGTLDADLGQLEGDWVPARPDWTELQRFARSFTVSTLASDLLGILEGARIEARVRAAYPGLNRQMDGLGHAWRAPSPPVRRGTDVELAVAHIAAVVEGGVPEPLASEAAARAAAAVLQLLGQVDLSQATVHDSLRVVQSAYPHLYALLERAAEGGTLEYRPSEAGSARGLKLQPAAESSERADSFLDSLRQRESLEASDVSSYAQMAQLLDSQDAPKGPMQNREPEVDTAGRPPGESRLSGDGIERVGSRRYPEWDHRIGDHRADWVQLTEYTLQPGSADFVDDIRQQHGPLIGRLRRSFEALRPSQPERQRGLRDGDELDMDCVVEARVNRRASGEMSDRLYQRRLPARRDVAVAFLVDLSSSTNEVANTDGKRIIDVEREALVLAAEAVDAIGDDCAIYGYSGYGRDQVGFYIAKDFQDPWDDTVRRRVGRMSWKMENRDGAAIRHAVHKLSKHPAKVRLLLILSDGKPLDCGCDTYSDIYAQEDTRVALQSARKAGVHPFCITVDPHGRDYLGRMYGEHGYTIIDRVQLLPERLPAVYRRLTR